MTRAKGDATGRRSGSRRILEGNEAVALGAALCGVQVIAAYPITPSSSIVEKLSVECACGRLDARFVEVESEHSAMACLIGAAQTGARTFTATSSQGLAYMHELLHWAAGGRLPIVIADVNRALATPWNIFADHQDSLSQRDTGWMQIYCRSVQEVLDALPLAFHVAERVLIPCMVCLDGFILSHTSEGVAVPDAGAVREFIGPLELPFKLDLDDPRCFGAPAPKNSYHELRMRLDLDHHEALRVFEGAFDAFAHRFGRRYALVETHAVEDAEVVFVVLGTAAGTARFAVDHMREEGRRAGVLSPLVFRPFPAGAICEGLRGKRVVVLDRDCSFGKGGILATEVRAATAHLEDPPEVFSVIAGMGGRDVTAADFEATFDLAIGGGVGGGLEPRGSRWIGILPGFERKEAER